MMKNLECVINSGLLRHLDKSEYIEAIEALNIQERRYKRGETIFYEGDKISSICLVKEGSVRVDKNYSNGEVHILSLMEEDTLFGLEVVLSKRRTSHVDYIANENCLILFIVLDQLENTKLHDPIREALTEMLADENIRMAHKIEILAERGLRDRVLVYLDILAKKAESNIVSVRMSREQLAQFLRVNRSALSNELSKMKKEGILDFTRYEFRLLKYSSDGTRSA